MELSSNVSISPPAIIFGERSYLISRHDAIKIGFKIFNENFNISYSIDS